MLQRCNLFILSLCREICRGDIRVLFLFLNIAVASLYREPFYEKRNLCSQFTISNPIEPLDCYTHQHSHTQKWCAYDPDCLMEMMHMIG